jgi:hypothetical protein
MGGQQRFQYYCSLLTKSHLGPVPAAAGVAVSGKTVIARTVLGAAGVKASPAAKWLRARTDNAGRVEVAPPPNACQRALRICSSLL